MAIAAVWINKKVIVAEAVSLIERRTGADLHFDEARLRFIFPFTGIHLSELSLRNDSGKTWFYASKVFVRLNPWSLLRDDYRFPLLRLENARLTHTIDQDGNTNLPFSTNPSRKNAQDHPIGIERINLKSLDVLILDEQHSFRTHLHVKKANLSLNVNHKSIDFNWKGDLESRFITSKEDRFANNCPLKVHLLGSVDLDNDRLIVGSGILESERNGLELQGVVGLKSPEEELELNFKGDEFDPSKWIRLLPPEMTPIIETKGISASCKTDLKLRYKSDRLLINWENDCKAIDLDNGYEGKSIHCSSTAFQYSNVNDPAGEIKIHYLDCGLEGIEMRGSGVLSNLGEPSFTGMMLGFVEPHKILADHKLPVYFYNGRFEIDTLEFANFQLSKKHNQNNRIRLIGHPSELDLEYEELRLQLDGGSLTYTEDNFEWHSCSIKGDDFDLTCSGGFPVGRGGLSSNAHYDLNLEGKYLNIEALLSLINNSQDPGVRKKVSSKMTSTSLTVPDKGHVSFLFDQMKYKDVVTDNAQGHIHADNKGLNFLIESDYAQGSIHGIGTYEFRDEKFDAKFKTFDCELSEVFRQWNGFGQSTLTFENISGRVNGWYDIKLQGWEKDKLEVSCALDLTHGRLKNFPLLEQFSNYIHAQDLKDIRFSRLRNMFMIEDGKLIIPTMFIRSNAANLTIAGEHGLDNDIRYHLSLNAGQVLMEKMKDHDPALRPLKPNKKGLINLHYTIAGSMDEFVYYRGKKDVKRYFDRSADFRMRIRNKLLRSFPNIQDWVEMDIWDDIPELEQDQIPEHDYLDW
jgi:hypothetical protein